VLLVFLLLEYEVEVPRVAVLRCYEWEAHQIVTQFSGTSRFLVVLCFIAEKILRYTLCCPVPLPPWFKPRHALEPSEPIPKYVAPRRFGTVTTPSCAEPGSLPALRMRVYVKYLIRRTQQKIHRKKVGVTTISSIRGTWAIGLHKNTRTNHSASSSYNFVSPQISSKPSRRRLSTHNSPAFSSSPSNLLRLHQTHGLKWTSLPRSMVWQAVTQPVVSTDNNSEMW